MAAEDRSQLSFTLLEDKVAQRLGGRRQCLRKVVHHLPASHHRQALDFGRGDQAVLEFERDGVQETVRAGDGDATGMKWLAGRKDCLVVKAGEGYCRD